MDPYGSRKRGVYAAFRADPGALSSGTVSTNLDGSCYYDTNITAAMSNNFGITSDGVHGQNATFSDTRSSNPIISETKDYMITLVRGSLTTNNIPLCVPTLRQTASQGPTPITEYGVQSYELAMQPGLSCTWTGQVYDADMITGVSPYVEMKTASWPTYGRIYYYNQNINPSTSPPNTPVTKGFMNLATYGVSADTTSANVASRLTAAFAAAGLSYITVTITDSGSPSTYTQKLSFVNSSTILAVYLDFTVPGTSTVTQSYSKAGMLQACKLLGFQPNSVFSIMPSSTVVTPRQLQLGFRATLELSCYKNCRWVPEDDSAIMPTPADISNGYTGSYFDCYTYEHMMNQVVNPTFVRCISDEADSGAIISEQCLNRQLSTLCKANCGANMPWSPNTIYSVGDTVLYKGYAYIAQYATGNNVQHSPIQVPGSPSSTFWLSCGPAIQQTWVSGVTYKSGDLVTYIGTSSNSTIYVSTGSSPTPNISPDVDTSYWSSVWTLGSFNVISTNIPTIGTIPPFLTYTSATRLFKLNLDSYGFGGTLATNADDGFLGTNDDAANTFQSTQQILNASYNDQARDSWGVTGLSKMTGAGTNYYTTARHPGICYDEKFCVEADDYFNCLFGNWPTLRLTYVNPQTNIQTSYVRYTPQAFNMGLGVPLPLPIQATTTGTTGYLPYDRISGNVIYLYTAQQDYPSVGNMWNPVDTVLVVTSHVPLTEDQTQPINYIGDTTATLLSRSQNTAQTLAILAEFVVKSADQPGQQYRSEIIFEPQLACPVPLKSSSDFKTFDYAIKMRMKGGGLRDVSLSPNGGSLFMRFRLDRTARSLGARA